MRSVFSVILDIIAGFFFYMACLLGFIVLPEITAKFAIMLGSLAVAIVLLCCGLAIKRFRNWKTHAGVVLLSASGFTTFAVFTFACLFMSGEFRAMMKPDMPNIFSDYHTGGAFIAAMALLGLLLLKTNRSRAGHAPAPGADKPN